MLYDQRRTVRSPRAPKPANSMPKSKVAQRHCPAAIPRLGAGPVDRAVTRLYRGLAQPNPLRIYDVCADRIEDVVTR
jgi:hypothetical protein